MPLARRLALLAWARRSESWVVEDDYDSEYRYAGRPLTALNIACFPQTGLDLEILAEQDGATIFDGDGAVAGQGRDREDHGLGVGHEVVGRGETAGELAVLLWHRYANP